jgi:hypothetical protein
MGNTVKIEKLKGKYALIGIIIVVLFGSGGFLYYILPAKKVIPQEGDSKIEVRDNNSSPVANKIETQNNYFGENQSPPKDSSFKAFVKSNLSSNNKKQKVKSFSEPQNKDSLKSKNAGTTVNANNALIVTNQQSGGENTVNVQRIPEPVFELAALKMHNEEVKKIIPNGRVRNNDTIFLPSEKYNYNSLYKTEFTLKYSCPVNLNSIILIIKRKDVVYHDIIHKGRMQWGVGSMNNTQYLAFQLTQPENGYYTFTLYTVNKFGKPMEEFAYLKE